MTKAGVSSLQHIAQKHPDALFEVFDTDRNGTVSIQELVHGCAMLHPANPPKQKIRWAFEKFDRDNSGRLTPQQV